MMNGKRKIKKLKKQNAQLLEEIRKREATLAWLYDKYKQVVTLLGEHDNVA